MKKNRDMIALSTCWHYRPEMNIADWLLTVKEIGFDAIELDYQITRAHLSALQELLPREACAVSSVHNFCPVPNDGPSPRHQSNYYRLSALDESERQKATYWTQRTIDTAVSFGARAVVIHAGAVAFEDERSTRLRELYKEGEPSRAAFIEERSRILSMRSEKRGPHLSALKKSFDEIFVYLQGKNVVLGVESRYYPLEIPNFDEIGYFLGLYHGQGLFYWHDAGHSQMNENLGITDNLAYLQAYSKRMIGMHIHDMRGTRDHYAPFTGDINFKAFLPFLKECPLKVWEVKDASVEELRSALIKFKSYLKGEVF